MTETTQPPPSTVPPPDKPATPRQLFALRRILAPDNRLTLVATVAMVSALALWMSFTPGGILGKADAVGYAVCHRIGERSFAFPNGRQLPLCARCSGTFLGVLAGLVVPGLAFKRRRAGMFPPLGMLVFMLGFSLWWAVDGANSYTLLLPYELPRLYNPTNFLRLVTGTFHGITMGSVLLPIANASLWADATPERTIGNVWQMLALYAIGGVLIAMVMSGWAVFLYPLAILSAGGAMAVLVVVNTVIMSAIIGQDNTARTWREALPMIFFGVAVTISMLGVIDTLRFVVFRTWDGFVFPVP